MAITEFRDYVKKRPEIFFGQKGANPIDICSEIARGAMTLGAMNVQIGVVGSWHYIFADIDWFSVKLKHEYQNELEIFEKMNSFPEYFVNATRYEPMTNIYSDALITSKGEKAKLIKGEQSDIQLFEKEFQHLKTWARIIAFKFNEHA